MLCLSGFELYSRWVPLNNIEEKTKRFTRTLKRQLMRCNSYQINNHNRQLLLTILSCTLKFSYLFCNCKLLVGVFTMQPGPSSLVTLADILGTFG